MGMECVLLEDKRDGRREALRCTYSERDPCYGKFREWIRSGVAYERKATTTRKRCD